MQKNSENNNHFTNSRRRSFLVVWIAAIIGILFFVPAIPKHVPAQVLLKYSMNTIIFIAIIQLTIFTTLFAAVGSYLAPRIGFRAYLADVSINKKVFWMVLKRQFFYGASIGLAGAIVAYCIAPDFIVYLTSYPFLSRMFGGLTEEVMIRWGIMTFLVWALWRIVQHGIGIPKKLLMYSGILLSQIMFAFGHMNALNNFGITNPLWSVCTIFMVSLPWGWLFWKQGLESAFIAHASFHAFIAFFVAIKL
jgi:hypothetical protein